MHPSRRGTTILDLVVATSALIVAGAIAGPMFSERDQWMMLAQNRLKDIGRAAAANQHDYQNYLPLPGTRSPRGIGYTTTTVQGMCSWQFGGKHNSSFWYSTFSGTFDIEAEDRPLNAYVYPGRTFGSPTPPQRLGQNAAARTSEQAEAFRDPSDKVTRQRNWPNINAGVSTYNDVGTSFLTPIQWQSQVMNQGFSFANAIVEGNRRIARSVRMAPDRFVWCADETINLLVAQTSATYQIRNSYGDVNQGNALFVDGHVTYIKVRPGRVDSFRNREFQFVFD
jgi:prepilin-type processing-associated H-X9-DG protein